MTERSFIKDYQAFTPTTWIPTKFDREHAISGLAAEAGEVAGAYQKFFRGDYGSEELDKRLVGEIGGLLYYISMVCNIEGLDLEQIMRDNMAVLIDRKERGKIKGDGDEW